MKKIFLPCIFLFLAACTVDSNDLLDQGNHFKELNAIVEVEGCDVESYNFSDIGKIEVTNDAENLFVTVVTTAENFYLSSLNLHIANSKSEFPTVGQGNLPPGNMDHTLNFDPDVKSHTFTFPLSEIGDCVLIASQATFFNGGEFVTAWAGDYIEKNGHWSYLEYCVQECIPTCDPVYTGPAVLSGTVTYTEAAAKESYDEVRKLFSNLIPREHYFGTSQDLGMFSRYSPSMTAIVTQFHSLSKEPFDTFDLKTTFTYGSGECAGTVDIILTVIDNR